MVMKPNASGISWVHEAAIGSSDWLEDDIVADVVLEETVLGHWISGFFSAHDWNRIEVTNIFIFDKFCNCTHT